jgi:MerR family transcriptional regulator/heat shock protein HspR
VFSIGEVAARFGVSVQVLRLYEQRGLILIEKGPGGQRRYAESDVERLACIRTAITEHKISIEGIRRLQSLVPCWEHVHCSARQRSRCPAYLTPTAGCWTHAGRNEACRNTDCRHCEVYRLSSDCDGLKALIHRVTLVSHSRQSRHKDRQA